jgi:hypothetical protein
MDFQAIRQLWGLDTLDMSAVSVVENCIPGDALIQQSSLKSVLLPSGITRIGKWAFYMCGIQEMIIPAGTLTIEEGAFFMCRELETLSLPSTLTGIGPLVFFGCSVLTEVVLPDALETIGEAAFFDCLRITSFTVPASVTSIGVLAFHSINTVNITVDEANNHFRSVDGVLFDKNQNSLIQYPAAKVDMVYAIPATIDSIFNYAFYLNPHLLEVTIPASVASITSMSFSNCNNLVAIEVDETNPYYSDIDDVLFNKSQSLLIKFPAASVTEYEIPESVTHIGDYAFGSSTQLTSVSFPEALTTIGNSSFSGCTGLTSISLSEELTTIGDYAFINCAFDSINIPASVYSIGEAAFNNCKMLKKITIPAGVDSIFLGTFFDCIGMTEITLPSTLVYFHPTAMNGCSNLAKIKINASIPPLTGLGSGFLQANTETSVLQVPAGSVAEYEAHSLWSIFNNIVGFDFELSLSENTLSIDQAEGSTVEFGISSNTEWAVEDDQDWLQISQIKGMDNGKIVLIANANPIASDRQAIVTINGLGVDDLTVTVVQAGLLTGTGSIEADELQIHLDELNNLMVIKGAAGKSLEVFNLQGICVRNRTLKSNHEQITMQDMPSGVYMIKVGERTVKISKQ